jgi:ribosomal protein S1
VGEELPLKIIEVTEESNRLLLNHLPVLLRLRELRVGQIVSGIIRAVRDYGVIVDIGDLNALFFTNSSINHPSQTLKVNDQLKATILELDTHQYGRVILGN